VYALTTRFKLPQSTDWGRLRTIIAERALVYAGVPGLRSKAFVLDERTGDYGANYVWESRAALDAFLQSELFKGAIAKFGEPQMQVHEIVAYVDGGAVIG
jgi:Domain of unknown function (DUF4865)